MELNRIKVAQRSLRNPQQVGEMVATLQEGAALPAVLLAELEDGTIFIQDGHHRCLAYALAGRESLAWGDYLLLQVDNARAMSGDLCDRSVQEGLLGAEVSTQLTAPKCLASIIVFFPAEQLFVVWISKVPATVA